MTKSKRIYIIGSVASGKTTLARYLSKKLNIPFYSLDKVIWDDNNGTKRNQQEVKKQLKQILKKDTWIIEDVGRKVFVKGREKADTIYFINLKKSNIYFRVFKRWIKQKLNLEEADYQPTLKSLVEMLGWAKNYKKTKLNELEEYHDKLIILDKKAIKKIYKED